jgi:DNA-binding HxlR family transcriptional regulator
VFKKICGHFTIALQREPNDRFRQFLSFKTSACAPAVGDVPPDFLRLFLLVRYFTACTCGGAATVARLARLRKRAQMSGILTNRCKIMADSDKKFLATMPKLKSRHVEILLEEVIGCRWTISVLGAVAKGVLRPGALERHIEGISAKVLADRLRHFTRAGIFERVQFPEIPPRVEYRLTDFGKKFMRLLKEVEKLQAELNDTKVKAQSGNT